MHLLRLAAGYDVALRAREVANAVGETPWYSREAPWRNTIVVDPAVLMRQARLPDLDAQERQARGNSAGEEIS